MNEAEKQSSRKNDASIYSLFTALISQATVWAMTVLMVYGTIWGFGYTTQYPVRLGTVVWCLIQLVNSVIGGRKG